MPIFDSFPYDDRAMTENDWKLMFGWVRSTGVLTKTPPLSAVGDLAVAPDGGMMLQIYPGEAWIEGFYFTYTIDPLFPGNYTFTISNNATANPRIDLVILELNLTTNTLAFTVSEGIPAVIPAPPALIQNDLVWQFPLAAVLVGAGVIVINAGDITNMRVISVQTSSINPTLTSAGAGASLVNDGVGPTLATKSLVAGSNMSIVSSATELTLSVGTGGTPLQVQYADTSQLDAFGRLRVSETTNLADSILRYDKQPLIWDEVITGGTSTFNTNQSSVTLAVTTTDQSVVRQTFAYYQYFAGKSQLIYLTGNFNGTVANVVKRIGYFDANNGLFFENNGTGMYVVQRTNTSGAPSDATRAAQAAWNVDPMNGTGPSGVTLNFSLSQVMFIDCEWLGCGRVRFGFVVNGVPYVAHEFFNANLISTVYMSTAKLPCRFEISSTGGSSTLTQICSTVITEGSASNPAKAQSVSTGVTGKSIAAAAGLVPLMSVRLNASYNRATLIPTEYSIFSDGAQNFLYQIVILNGTSATPSALTGATWAASLGYADIDYAGTAITGASSTNYTVIDSGYVAGTLKSVFNTLGSATIPNVNSYINGTSQIMSIMVNQVTGGAQNYYASLNFNQFS